jgi:hypothetical protein
MWDILLQLLLKIEYNDKNPSKRQHIHQNSLCTKSIFAKIYNSY